MKKICRYDMLFNNVLFTSIYLIFKIGYHYQHNVIIYNPLVSITQFKYEKKNF